MNLHACRMLDTSDIHMYMFVEQFTHARPTIYCADDNTADLEHC